LIHLYPGVSPDKTIDALFAFTACETSVAPLGCVIEDNKPLFVGVSHMLKFRQPERKIYCVKLKSTRRIKKINVFYFRKNLY
jgi:topoisomerase-4 subunit A